MEPTTVTSATPFRGKFSPAVARTVDCITVTPPQQRYKNEAVALSGFPSAT
jgi:hypothetical protein